MASMAIDTSCMEPQPADAALLLSAFRKVSAILGLTLPEQAALLGVSRATVAGWKEAPGHDPDKLDRMALFVGIFGLAGEAFPGERGGEGWLRRANRAELFAGLSPLELLLKGRFESLFRVYDQLQAMTRVW